MLTHVQRHRRPITLRSSFCVREGTNRTRSGALWRPSLLGILG